MSRELDEKIARVVMGHRLLYWPGVGYDLGLSEGEPWKFADESDPRHAGAYQRLCDEYSTDIAAAWQVVDQMRELGWDWIVSQDRDDKLATAEFQHPDGRIGFAQHENVAEAICQAADAALETK